MTTTILAPKLEPGDKIAIVSPSWGGAALFPHRVALGVRQIESLGFSAVFGSHALGNNGSVSDSAENRARDLHEMFEPGKEVVAFHGDEECAELVRYYLEHEGERLAVARAGRQRTLREHTLAARIQQVASLIEGLTGD